MTFFPEPDRVWASAWWRRALSGFLLGWAVTFAALLLYWMLVESGTPGQQYADPFGPCAVIAVAGGLFGWFCSLVRRRMAYWLGVIQPEPLREPVVMDALCGLPLDVLQEARQVAAHPGLVRHIWAINDVIAHLNDRDGNCPCNPVCEPLWCPDGSCAWLYIHRYVRGVAGAE
jgi:hypothetical protein